MKKISWISHQKKVFSGGRGSSGRKFCNLWLYLSPAILFCPRQQLSTYLNYYLTCFCSYFWAKKRNKTFDPTICSLVSRFFPLLLIFFCKKKSDKIRNVSVCVRYLVHPPRWYFSNLHFCLRISTKDYWDLMCNDAFLDEIFNLSERKSRYVFHSGTKRKKLLWWKIAIRYLYGMAT